MTHPAKPDANNANRHARYGLSLPQQTLRALEKRGIYCQPSVSIEHQHLARRYVLRGVESGGAVADMGRYCAYLDADGKFGAVAATDRFDLWQRPARHRHCAGIGADRDAAYRPYL